MKQLQGCVCGIFSVLIFFSAGGSFAATLTFDEALEQIVDRSPEITIQKAQLEATRALALPARFAFVPSLSFDAKRSWMQTWAPEGVSNQIEGVAQLNLIHWGSDLASLKAADLDIEAQEESLADSRLKEEGGGIAALVDQIQRNQEIAINHKIVEIQAQLFDIAQKRYKAGLLSQQEVDKVSIDLENARASQVDSELQGVVAQSTLKALVGDGDVQLEWPWKERMSRQGLVLLKSTSSELSLRPDWRLARLHAEAAEQRYQKKLKLLLPSVDGSMSYGHYVQQQQSAYSWTAAITVTLPFFDHLQTYSDARAQSFVRESSEATYVQVQRTALADWEIAKDSFEKSHGAALSREKTVGVSRKLYEDNLKRFQSGRISANDLVIDQRRLLDSEFFAVQGWKTAHLSYARLCHALGRRMSKCLN